MLGSLLGSGAFVLVTVVLFAAILRCYQFGACP